MAAHPFPADLLGRGAPADAGCGWKKQVRPKATQMIGAALLAALAFAGTPSGAQETSATPSLGEVARRLKAEREKQKQKPVAVYTNDNLPQEGSAGIVSLKRSAATKQQTSPAGSAAASAAAEEHDGKYFRSKADKIRARLQFHRRQLAVLQQELGLGKMQYYPNPQKTLEQESTPAFQSDVAKLRSQIADKQKQISADEKAMDDLQQELRREGGDPGWIRQ